MRSAMDYYCKATRRPLPEGLVFAGLVDDNDLPWSDFKVLKHVFSVESRSVSCTVATEQNLHLAALLRWTEALRDVRVAVGTIERPAPPVAGINITGDLTTGHGVAVYASYDGSRGDAILRAVGMTLGDEARVVPVSTLRRAA